MSHTKEPWSCEPCLRSPRAELLDSNGNLIGSGDYEGVVSFYIHDARRIVACINACEGVFTETLEHAPKVIGRYIRQGAENQASIDTYRDLCGELLEALNRIHDIAAKGNATGTNRALAAEISKNAITKAAAVIGENSNG